MPLLVPTTLLLSKKTYLIDYLFKTIKSFDKVGRLKATYKIMQECWNV